jgi:hypothetical protein
MIYYQWSLKTRSRDWRTDASGVMPACAATPEGEAGWDRGFIGGWYGEEKGVGGSWPFRGLV